MSNEHPSRFVTEYHPDRHSVVDNCIHTKGGTPGRDTTCMICLEEMTEEDKTVTHGLAGQGQCNNAFHVSCFDGLVASAELADELDPVGANSTEPGKQFAKCPMCRGALYPYEKQGCRLPPALAAVREQARFQAVYEHVAGEPLDHHDLPTIANLYALGDEAREMLSRIASARELRTAARE